ncbi:MAG: sugar ABC transporter permease [Ruminococcus sp.]|nr:sugar ABC transporter permease [Ruminococcus sp.]MBQ7133805.1 sugar ABC transporter permease [Ruminococcus sp.]
MADVKKKKKKKHSNAVVNSVLLRRPIRRAGWFFLLPMVAAFLIGFIWPFLQGMFLSFCKFTTTSQWEWIGFKNYVRAFKDTQFMYSFGYTALWTIVSVILINVLAFTVAYALTQSLKGTNIFRTVFFMPNLIGGIVLGYIWNMIFNGILSYFNTDILRETKYGFWGLIILMCWQQIGYMMIIYIAGLQAIPEDMMEAAKIDGASGWKTLTKITIPNVMPSITICMFLSITNGFKLFDQNLALTGGQPFVINPETGGAVHTTEMIALNIYNTFTESGSFAKGTAQAKAVLFFILVAAIGLMQLRSTRNKEVQQ